MKYLYLFFVLFLIFNLYSATRTTSTAEYTEVQDSVDVSSSGDSVVVPADTATWDTTLAISENISLVGSGLATTLIKSDGSTRLIYISANGDLTIRISGFTFDAESYTEILYVANSSNTTPIRNMRIHHNKFMDCNGAAAIKTNGLIFGCIDNNQFDDNSYDMKHLGQDDYSWNLFPVDSVGTRNYLYIEDNTSTGFYTTVISSGEGARWVFRYNTVDGASTNPGDLFIDGHGDTQNRGVVGWEVYENTFTNVATRLGIDHRGGRGLAYNNSWDGTNNQGGRFHMREEHDGCTVAECDGSSGGDEVQGSYHWNNTVVSSGDDVVHWEYDVYEHIEEDTSWWDDEGAGDTNFNIGLESGKPASPSDDDCYWSTDTDSLWRSVGDNNWTFIYTPYTYPHPLRGAQEASSGLKDDAVSIELVAN